MSRNKLEERFKALLSDIGIPRPFDLATFCERLAAHRGRPLTLLPFVATAPDDPSGVWLPTEDADYVFFEERTSPLHREHIVLHELGHLLCGHEARRDEALRYLARLLPDVRPSTVASVLALRRTGYTVSEEWEAETFARVVGSRTGPRYGACPGVVPELAGAVSRALETLGPPR